MSIFVLEGKDIEPYFPEGSSDARKQDLLTLTQEAVAAVHNRGVLAFSYYGNNEDDALSDRTKDEKRLIIVCSAYLQRETAHRVNKIVLPNYIQKNPNMLAIEDGARQAIGIDGFEIPLVGSLGKTSFKSFHLDQLALNRFISKEEILDTFELHPKADVASVSNLLEGNIDTPDGFVRNTNHWFREYLAQVPSKADLLK